MSNFLVGIESYSVIMFTLAWTSLLQEACGPVAALCKQCRHERIDRLKSLEQIYSFFSFLVLFFPTLYSHVCSPPVL